MRVELFSGLTYTGPSTPVKLNGSNSGPLDLLSDVLSLELPPRPQYFSFEMLSFKANAHKCKIKKFISDVFLRAASQTFFSVA